MQQNELNKTEARLGFIGLGIMGSRLTRRLHASGWNIHAWNRSPEPTKELSQAGVPIAASINDLVANSDVVLSSLANDVAVNAVYRGDAGVFSSAKPGTIVLEMRTISPQLSHLLHRAASSLGVRLLDTAISGSAPAVEAGTVTSACRWRSGYLRAMHTDLRVDRQAVVPHGRRIDRGPDEARG